MSVAVNAPKTPVTKGSNGIATATMPNVCKMPGPPAPFVPTPLPNIGKTGSDPKDYSTTVKVENNPVAIKGASFGSMGDVASKGTGGGMVSSNVEGPCKFVAPGSMDVKMDGGNVQLLGDQVTNNGASSGSPANSATMTGTMQLTAAEKKEIREKMKKVPVCPDGNPTNEEHEWEEEPDCPKGSTQESVDLLKNSKNPSEQFEGAAAQANIDRGDLTIDARDRENKVSRAPTAEERKNGDKGDAHKVHRKCKRKGCGNKSEVDHVIDGGGQAEAKDITEFDKYEQLLKNQTIQKQTGAKIMYKINGNKDPKGLVKATIEYAAKVCGLHTEVLSIF